MVEPEAGILRLATELRQMIYDDITIANADRTIKVTLDEHDKLHFEICELIMNTVCADTIFRQEMSAYLFHRFTFVLADSERTCYPIVAAFSKTLSPKNLVCVRKIVMPFFTIRGLFDPVHFDLINKTPYVLRTNTQTMVLTLC